MSSNESVASALDTAAPVARRRGLRLALVSLAAAVAGSAGGAAFLLLPALALGGPEDWRFAFVLIFLFSLPFTLVGAAILAGLSLCWRDALSRRWTDYGGLILAAMPIGTLMPLPWAGVSGMAFGTLFAIVTAGFWSLLYRTFALPSDHRGFSHG